jgi:predicted DNA-binding transcriptional regulator AlpA
MSTVIVTTPEALASLVREAVREGVEAATAKQTVNATELAAMIGVSPRTLARMRQDGSIPHPTDGRWSRSEIARWMADRS